MVSFLLALWFVVDVGMYICVILYWKNFRKQVVESWEINASFHVKLVTALLTILFLGPFLLGVAVYKRLFDNPA